MSEPSDLARVASLLTTRLYGRSLEVLAETGSTNDDARAAAERGVPRGHVVVADAQRSGRGARGAVWVSPPGTDLYVSIVERLELAPREVATLTLAVGLGDTREDVLAAYADVPAGEDAEPREDPDQPDRVRIGNAYACLSFSLTDGRVSGILLGSTGAE